MPRVTKLELENTVEELKKQLDEQKKHYLALLNKNDERYNKLVNEREGQFHLLPEYQQMKKEIEWLEIIKKSNEDTIKRKEEKEKS